MHLPDYRNPNSLALRLLWPEFSIPPTSSSLHSSVLEDTPHPLPYIAELAGVKAVSNDRGARLCLWCRLAPCTCCLRNEHCWKWTQRACHLELFKETLVNLTKSAFFLFLKHPYLGHLLSSSCWNTPSSCSFPQYGIIRQVFPWLPTDISSHSCPLLHPQTLIASFNVILTTYKILNTSRDNTICICKPLKFSSPFMKSKLFHPNMQYLSHIW